MRRVVVTGVGLVCSLGRGKEDVWQGIQEGRRGFLPLSLFDGSEASRAPVAAVSGLGAKASRAAGSRLDRMIEIAAREAINEAGFGQEAPPSRFGVAVGNSNGGMLEAEEWYRRQLQAAAGARGARRGPLSAAPILRLPGSVSTDRLASLLGLRGPRLTVTTACSSSAAAIALAAERIREGEAPGMIAGGGDPLCRLTYAGFSALRLLDPEGCRPFDRLRKGLTLGEGAALLVMEERERARDRGARPLAEILEHGASCDAYHMTGCHPEGRGMKSAMAEALDRSGLTPDRIDYVNAHGTATPANDAAEARAIADLFGENGPAVSSTKSMHGHLLGGSGAVEAAVTILAIARGGFPPTAGTTEKDPGLPLDLVEGRPRPGRPLRAISNSFGFGGGNLVLVIADPEATP